MGIKTFAFHIDPSRDIESLWQLLEEAGCILLYSDVSEKGQYIFGNLPDKLKKEDLLAQYPRILNIEAIELPEIDWEAQWAAHEDYREGFLHVDLKHYAPKILFKNHSSHLKLIPGPGFGDLSHPTTRIVLRLMAPYVPNQNIVDVGCGSGILSLAAVAMGAHSVCGLDIDGQALIHSQANSECNEIQEIEFFLPENFQKRYESSVILMNMIQSEQEVAWNSLASVSDSVAIVVTSGVLSEGRADYLKLCFKWGWQLIEELEEEGWLGFVWSACNLSPLS